jgi:hypothetical protein
MKTGDGITFVGMISCLQWADSRQTGVRRRLHSGGFSRLEPPSNHDPIGWPSESFMFAMALAISAREAPG